MTEAIFKARLSYFWDGVCKLMSYGSGAFGGILQSDPEFIIVACVLIIGLLVSIMRGLYYVLRRL